MRQGIDWSAGLFLLVCLALSATPAAHAQTAAESAAFHARVMEVYSFEPHTLTTPQRQAKSAMLDEFWKSVQSDPQRNLPLLRKELSRTDVPAFFSYDGSKLLLYVSRDKADMSIALAAIPRVDLRGVDRTDYLLSVHALAREGLDTTEAAFHILGYPSFQALIPQHVLLLGQNYSFIYMLFPMREAAFLPALLARIETEAEPTAQKTLLLALSYTVTPEGRAALTRFADNPAKPKEARDYAARLLEGSAATAATPGEPSAAQLREQRRKALSRVSKQALQEFDRLTDLIQVRK